MPLLRKALGQHHLVDPGLVAPLLEFLSPAGRRVLEIGPGGEITVIADRRADSRYVDRRLVAVGYGIYVGGFLLYLNDMDLPIIVPEQYLDFATADYKPINEQVFPSRREAEAALASSDASSDSPSYAYFEGGGGRLIAPTVFSTSSAPRTIETARIAVQQLKEEVQKELVVLCLTLVGGIAVQAAVRGIVRVGEGKVTGPPEIPVDPVQAGTEIGQEVAQLKGVPKMATIAERVSALHLSQTDAAAAVESAVRGLGQNLQTGSRVALPSGDLVVTPKIPLPGTKIIVVHADGTVVQMRGDVAIDTSTFPPTYSVTNITPK